MQILKKEITRDLERKKKAKRNTIESIKALYESRRMILSAFKNWFISVQSTKKIGNPDVSTDVTKVSDCLSLKILTPKEMLQRLLIALAQIKTGKNKYHYVLYIYIYLQLYWNGCSTWVFSCKFGAYFQNISS